MKSTSVKEARIRRRRTEILQAAASLFQEVGYHDTTTHAIAERGGMSVGLIYQYFGNKADVLQAVIVDILEDFRDVVPKAMADASDPVDRLRLGFGALLQVIDDKPEATVLAYRESMTLTKEGRDEVKRLDIETAEPFRQAIVDGIEAGRFAPVDAPLVVHNILLTAHGWALKRWRLHTWLDLETYTQREFDLLLRAIRAE